MVIVLKIDIDTSLHRSMRGGLIIDVPLVSDNRTVRGSVTPPRPGDAMPVMHRNSSSSKFNKHHCLIYVSRSEMTEINAFA